MPVRRQVFRIEERARTGAPMGRSAREQESSSPQQLARELRELRALIATRAGSSPSRPGAAAAVSIERELHAIRAAVAPARPLMRGARSDLATADDVRLGEELDAVAASTEAATVAVLKSAEAIDRAAGMLVAALKSDHDQALAADIREQVARIFEACNFQDLAGQRIDKVKRTLSGIEAHADRLRDAWATLDRYAQNAESDQVAQIAQDGQVAQDGHARVAAKDRLLNGPGLPGDADRLGQSDVDRIFDS